MEKLFGVIPPMITPLTPDENIDRQAVKRFVDFLIQGGVHGLFALGSMGEGAFLRPSVRQEMAAATVEAAGGRVPVIVGALETGTMRVVEEIGRLAIPGIAAYVVTTPYYYGGYAPGELREHFRRVADVTDRPILAYNIPQNTHVTMKAQLMLELASLPNVAGVKDSSGDWFENQLLLFGKRPSDFVVFQGNQIFCGASLLAGGDGLVPGHANVWPGLLVGMYEAARRKDPDAVWSAQARLNELLSLRGRAAIHTYKVIAQALGLMGDTVAAPLPRLSAEEAKQTVAAHAAIGLPIPAAGRS